MKRTTIMLPDELHERLRTEAFQRRVSVASLIRFKLEDKGPARTLKDEDDPILAVAGIGSDGTLTRNIDEDLYGPATQGEDN